jgi:nucleotide-binding universal stress UspA family protein
MTTSQQDSFESAGGELSADQLTQMLNAGLHGDTSAVSEEPGGAPATATDPASTPAAPAVEAVAKPGGDAAPAEPDPANAVVLAKDGKHTIPYEKLEQARQGEQRWKSEAERETARAAAAEAALAELQAQAGQRAADGKAPTETDKLAAQAGAAIEAGADPELFGDYSEEGMRAGLLKLHAATREQLKAELKAELQAEVERELAPLRQHRQASAEEVHSNAIYTAHPDVDSIAQSAEFDAWLKAMPSYAQSAARGVLDGGTTEQVVELFKDYKSATAASAAPAPKDPPNDPAKAAKEKLAALEVPVPNSLSDIPGGRPGGGTLFERLDSLQGADLFNAMNDLTEEQREGFLNRKT